MDDALHGLVELILDACETSEDPTEIGDELDALVWATDAGDAALHAAVEAQRPELPEVRVLPGLRCAQAA